MTPIDAIRDPVAGNIVKIETNLDRGTPGITTEAPGQGLFTKMLDEVSQLQAQSAGLEQQMYEGKPVELHQVMIAAEQAGTAFELLVETRNKLVEAYQELMRMPV